MAKASRGANKVQSVARIEIHLSPPEVSRGMRSQIRNTASGSGGPFWAATWPGFDPKQEWYLPWAGTRDILAASERRGTALGLGRRRIHQPTAERGECVHTKKGDAPRFFFLRCHIDDARNRLRELTRLP
jgi:hypothetical protein